MAKRYDALLPMVAKLQPELIVEVGVHRGIRAAKMIAAAGRPVQYLGFDVFETRGADFQEGALNGKGIATEAQARARLDRAIKDNPGSSYRLVIGDSRETLPQFSDLVRGFRTFAFIDGDHRVDAIASDYAALSGADVVVFDDYYRHDEDGNIPDLSLYGANQTVKAITGARVEVLPHGDACKHGGMSHLAVVRR